MSESGTIVDAMRAAVPPGRARLDDAEASALRGLTAELAAARPEAAGEYARFCSIADRELCLPEAELASRIGGAAILVTGGTGCIGSALMAQLAPRRPSRLVSVSRGITGGWPRQPGAEYRTADVTRPAAVRELMDEVRPDIVFHVAAQRSPALAEAEVHRTATVNVLGSRNVLTAAAEAGVPQVVCASTGKALRPYSPEIYTASKRAAEWIGATIARDSAMLCSAARFTHVIDNSIIHARLAEWAATGVPPVSGGPGGNGGTGSSPMRRGGLGGIAPPEAIRLHSAEIAFYVQSAVESAQLLLLAMLGAEAGEFRVHAISDLGWPVSLLDVALGVLLRTRSETPLYISGYDPGYEEVAFPGLYDPATAGDVSPLLNAFETAAATAAPCPMTDSFRLEMAPDPAAPKLLRALDDTCARTTDESAVRQSLDELSWALLDATLAAAEPSALARCAALVRRHEESMSPVHRGITQAIRTHADCP